MIQPSSKQVRQFFFLIKLNTHFPYDPEFLLAVYPRKKTKHMIIYGGIIHNNLKLETTWCQPTGEWENKIWNIHTMEYNSAIKRKELLIHTTWMNLKTVMLNWRYQTQKTLYHVIPLWQPKAKLSLEKVDKWLPSAPVPGIGCR